MSSFCRLDDLSQSSNDSYTMKGNDSLCETLSNFGKLRISALTKAAEISPLVKEVTIGPNSSPEKQKLLEETLEENGNQSECENKENHNEDKLGEDLRYTLNMRKIEAHMKENTEVLFKNLVEKMITKRAETMMRYWQKQSEDSERKALEIRSRKLRMLKELRENDNLSVLEKAKQDERTTQKINQQTLEGMNKILEEQNRAAARFASITDSHTKVCICYNEINNLLQTDSKSKAVCDKYINTLNTVSGNITTILDLCKTGTITEKEVKQAEVLAANIENIKKKIIEDIEEIKCLETERLKQEELAKQKEEERIREEKVQLEKEKQKVIEQPASKAVPMFYSVKNYAYYEELKNFLVQYENQYKDLVENKAYKKFKVDCQKAVNTPANTICGVTGAHLRDKYDKLSMLIKGERVQVLDTYVQATQHPQGLSFVTALLAKKIVKLGELLVSSNPDAAYPVAAVTAALLVQFPEFGKLLEAYFHRECPYIVPMYLPQTEGQSDKDFYLSRGYKYNEEGVVEKQNMFLKRMSGIFKLKCAIWIAKTPRFMNAPNPHGLKYAWKWIASFINLKPEPDISATLLHDFFNICGSECYKCYGKQFIKIIKVIVTQYMPILDNVDTGGPKSRLEDFLQNVLKTGHIPPPTGTLSSNAW